MRNAAGPLKQIGLVALLALAALLSSPASNVFPGSTAPSGPAGGDLSGTYPNPTVVAINGGLISGTSGDIPEYNLTTKQLVDSSVPLANVVTGATNISPPLGQETLICSFGLGQVQSCGQDACKTSGGYWAPLGFAASDTATITANGLYGWILPANSPLCTTNAFRIATNGSGHQVWTIWNCAATTQLATSNVATMAMNNWQNLTWSSAFQIQPNTCYVVTVSGDNTGDQVYTVPDNNFLGSVTTPAYSVASFTCANSASWSGGVPTLPGTCGARTSQPLGNLTIRFF